MVFQLLCGKRKRKKSCHQKNYLLGQMGKRSKVTENEYTHSDLRQTEVGADHRFSTFSATTPITIRNKCAFPLWPLRRTSADWRLVLFGNSTYSALGPCGGFTVLCSIVYAEVFLCWHVHHSVRCQGVGIRLDCPAEPTTPFSVPAGLCV